MENFIVISKVKKFIKDKADLNTSAEFIPVLNGDIVKSCQEAMVHAQKIGRKTVMGKDFNLYVENPKTEEIFVVNSKIKKFIKENSGLSTASTALEQLNFRVQTSCLKAIEKAQQDKRKTVMAKDFTPPINLGL